MSTDLDEQIRLRLRQSFAEPPLLHDFRPLVCVWRFPHLEAVNHSWLFLSSSDTSSRLLRLATWDRFARWDFGQVAPMEMNDLPLEPDELMTAFTIFSDLEILGDQRGGIYDGPHYGCDSFDERTGDITESKTWIRGDTFRVLGQQLPASLRQKMQWDLVMRHDEV